MIHLQWETTASPEGGAGSPARDAVSPTGDLLASPNFGICDTTHKDDQKVFDYPMGSCETTFFWTWDGPRPDFFVSNIWHFLCARISKGSRF
jgi:hypothetical protein